MTRIDPHDPSPMNRFNAIDRAEDAVEVVDGLLNGIVWPEVTLWRLRSYCEMAPFYGQLMERNARKQETNNARN